MSQTVKEIIQIVVFLLVVGILVMVAIIYPLGRTKAYLARADVDDFNPDSLPANDISTLADWPAALDTFRVEADGLTNLACVYMIPADSTGPTEADSLKGTAILLHDERLDRESMYPLARLLIERGWAVCLYDQRASGRSTGEYHSDGEYEASDLAEVIGYLGIRDQIHPPCAVVGSYAGADAALIAAANEPRIDAVVAINPYLTSERWLDLLMDEHDMYWIPLAHTLFEFWYEMRSGYAPAYRSIDDIEPPECPTVLMVDEKYLDDETMTKYQAAADGQVRLAALPAEPEAQHDAILDFVAPTPTNPDTE
jgi:pimeloyl-ACP methyl ester carboxylesterase